MKPETAISKIQASLSDDLRKPIYRGDPNPLVGHCYVAAEALYHLLGGKEAGYKPIVLRGDGWTHWYLLDPKGRILDPTRGQFDEDPLYAQGKPCGFLTKRPSKRAAILIERVRGKA